MKEIVPLLVPAVDLPLDVVFVTMNARFYPCPLPNVLNVQASVTPMHQHNNNNNNNSRYEFIGRMLMLPSGDKKNDHPCHWALMR
jgi:hypothetical protein